MADISKISPDNGTTIYNLKDIEARKRVPEVLLKDTVGWSGKNLLKPKKASGTSTTGISYSIDENGCKLNGTATSGFNVEYGTITLPQGSYVYTDDVVTSDNTYFMNVSPNPSTGSGNLNINNKPFSFTLSTETTLTFMVYVKSGLTLSNLTFYPMLRKADISDSTYEPYHKSVEEVVEQVYANIGLLTEPVPSYIARCLPTLKRNITDAFYNGSLRSEIAAGNFKNVRVGDYIIGQSTGSTYYVAELDWMYGKGDQTGATYQSQAYGQHHLGLMLYKHNGATRLWAGYGDANKGWRVSANEKGRCPWNAAADVDPTDTEAIGANDTNITRTYNNASVSGYMGSFIRERIDNIILTEDYIADFGSENVLKFRNLNGNAVATDKISGGQGNWNGCTSGWTWYDRYLDLPSEIEIYGSRIFGSAMDIGAQCEQLAMFKNARIHDIFPRMDFWMKAVASSSSAAFRDNYGVASGHSASFASWACPLACIR